MRSASSSLPRAPLNEKLQIIYDKNKRSIKIKNQLLKKVRNYSPKINNMIIVIGGDGFMLETLKKNKNSNKFFYGINSEIGFFNE